MNQTTAAAKVVLASYSGQLGGTEVRMRQVAGLLRRHGLPVSVLNPVFAGKAAFVRQMDQLGVPVEDFEPAPFFMQWRWRHLNYLRASLQARLMARWQRPDLLHAFFTWSDQGVEQAWCAARNGVPAVLSIHSSFSAELPVLPPWHRARAREAFATLRAYWAVSETALSRFQTLYGEFLPPQAVARVIYNSVDTERFVPDPAKGQPLRAELGVPPDAPLLGSVGRLSREKRPLALVEVFAMVLQQRPDAHFLLLGEGDMAAEVRARADACGLGGRLHLLPFTDAPEVVFNALDLHLLLSRSEGFGAVTAEAMACGVPVLGTRVAGTEEVIGDSPAGVLVPLGDERAAADAALSLLARPPAELQALHQAARDRAVTQFGRAGWEQQVKAVYQDAGISLD